MLNSLFQLFSHLLFIYLSHILLTSVIDWKSVFKGSRETGKIQVLLLFFAIALGYIVSGFFLDIVALSKLFVLQ
ncbi:TPA: DUF1146 domain-containing protein [Streptococcus suis]|uniref:DUF1146 domain-containing protein n=2 Tax=Streptococcus TaxID=1301 RepID=A0A4T2GL02_STRSU|nr:DUF1146 family protein [Streptococcus sp. 29896]MBL6538679.1 DUF1146 domain-containing protein [Streptococcus suis]MBM7270452.1 DUF1146 domain-containing protein [Streptococcus suis]MBM7314868.1 DUF1146 domain-containing protein [Streptococcus suis]MCK4027917.1 DUF1146 domain-containing protein [Streptococcus suis]NQG96656.1 DUF1146 domain-containing protein [Streptococcus suis]